MRLLRLVRDELPDAFGAELGARIGYTCALARRRPSTPLDAYPLPVFEAIHQAAMADVRAIRDRILHGEQLAAAGQDPEQAGWGRLESVCWYIANRGPLNADHRHRKEIRRRWGIARLNARPHLTRADTVPLVVALMCQTGLEPESVRALRVDCLVNPARGYVSIDYLVDELLDERRTTGDE